MVLVNGTHHIGGDRRHVTPASRRTLLSLWTLIFFTSFSTLRLRWRGSRNNGRIVAGGLYFAVGSIRQNSLALCFFFRVSNSSLERLGLPVRLVHVPLSLETMQYQIYVGFGVDESILNARYTALLREEACGHVLEEKETALGEEVNAAVDERT